MIDGGSVVEKSRGKAIQKTMSMYGMEEPKERFEVGGMVKD